MISKQTNTERALIVSSVAGGMTDLGHILRVECIFATSSARKVYNRFLLLLSLYYYYLSSGIVYGKRRAVHNLRVRQLKQDSMYMVPLRRVAAPPPATGINKKNAI